jgi:hypothetical protein
VATLLACPQHSGKEAMSASCSKVLVATVALRERMQKLEMSRPLPCALADDPAAGWRRR